ncbi:MAG TPA: hypothetical protein PK621_11100, partial [Syntrophales bacterium]|nr:hypothetical protein [Syntrophales bacterium]
RTSINMDNQDKPYIDKNGTIVIPFSIDQRYHFWNGGQDISVTLQEINTPEDIWKKYIKKPYPGKSA